MALTGAALAATPVTSLGYDYVPEQVAYRGLTGTLTLDGVEYGGRRGDKRDYLEAVLPLCPDAAEIERRRRRRWVIGNAIAMGSVGGVIVTGVVRPDAQGPMLGFAGGMLVGGTVAISGSSFRRSIAAYNHCSVPLNGFTP